MRWKAWDERVFKVKTRNSIPCRAIRSTLVVGKHHCFTGPRYHSSVITSKNSPHDTSQPWNAPIELGKKVFQMEEDDGDYIPGQEIDAVPIESHTGVNRKPLNGRKCSSLDIPHKAGRHKPLTDTTPIPATQKCERASSITTPPPRRHGTPSAIGCTSI